MNLTYSEVIRREPDHTHFDRPKPKKSHWEITKLHTIPKHSQILHRSPAKSSDNGLRNCDHTLNRKREHNKPKSPAGNSHPSKHNTVRLIRTKKKIPISPSRCPLAPHNTVVGMTSIVPGSTQAEWRRRRAGVAGRQNSPAGRIWALAGGEMAGAPPRPPPAAGIRRGRASPAQIRRPAGAPYASPAAVARPFFFLFFFRFFFPFLPWPLRA